MIDIIINNKTYTVQEAVTPEEQKKGLQGVTELPENGGMLFDFSDNIGALSFWMYNTLIPLDIIFINEDNEVIKVALGTPNDKTPIICDNVAYVLELNANSGVKEGDEIEFDDGPVMKVLGPNGEVLMELWSGERIISRRETKILIKKAKKADKSKSENDYKALGRYIFKVIKKLNERPAEYVQNNNNKS